MLDNPRATSYVLILGVQVLSLRCDLGKTHVAQAGCVTLKCISTTITSNLEQPHR